MDHGTPADADTDIASPAEPAALIRAAAVRQDLARLEVLRATGLLELGAETAFDRITRLAVAVLGVPAAFLSLVDEHRDVYIGATGLPEPLATARELSGETFCHHAISGTGPLVIPDTAADPTYRNVPTVHSLGVAAYVGVPLIVGGQAIGSFCVIDIVPHSWTSAEVEVLTGIADSALREIALRQANALLEASGREIGAANALLRERSDLLATALEDSEHGRQQVQQLLAQSETMGAQARAAADELQEQALELELVNQQLQDNTVELEAQTEELQATAAQLEEQTEVAEAARAKVEGILESMADAYFALDADFRIVAVNGAMERGTGLTRQAMIGHDFWSCFPAGPGSEFERMYLRAAVERLEGHFTHDYSDGRLDLVVDVDVYPAEGGGIAVFWRNVTERERASHALRAKEAQLRSFADAIPTLAWIARADGYIEWYNARWYEYTGTTPADMEGWGWQSVHDPARLPDVMQEWTRAIASGKRFEMTFPLRGADGTYHRFLTRVVPDRDDDDGEITRWFGTNTDIEAELAARDLAIESAARTERLQQLTSALASATSIDDAASVVVDDSAQLTGASSAGLCLLVPGTNEAVIVRHRGIDAGVAARYARMTPDTPGPTAACMRTGEPVFIESRDGPDGFLARFPAVRDDLERQGMHASATVPLIVGDVITGAMSFTFSTPRAFPVVERAFFTNLGAQAAQALERVRLLEAEHRALAAAEAAEIRLRDIFNQAPVAVAVLTGPDLVYTVVSPQYAVTPGGGRALLGRSVREAFPEEEYAPLLATMARVYHTGVPFRASERKVLVDLRGDGAFEPHYFNVGYQPLRDATGEVYAIASVTIDVTEQVVARQLVDVAREEAEHLRAVAEDANAAKTSLLSTMSHELRTPLNATLGYVDLLSLGIRGPVTDLQRADLERIRLANQHLLSLINDILNFARLEAGRLEFNPEPLLLDHVIAELEPLVAPLLAAKEIAFGHDGCSTDTPDMPHRVFADPERVRQVLLNLITNAVKFTEPGGRVSLACVDDGSDALVRITVSDTGRGIPASDLMRIFEPFIQIDRHVTLASQQGVGLGLAISRDLARGMSGDITVESEVGRGSKFTLALPRAAGGSATATAVSPQRS